MRSSKYLHNPLISGTLLLTVAGFLTKIIGFFYRIFLSRVFQDEGLGIIGLIAPVSMLVHSLCSAGLQNAITKYVAASKEHESESYSYLFSGIVISLSLTVTISVCIFTNADTIAAVLIHESRTAPLLRILALSFPMASVHTCLNGYFYGWQKAGIPSWSIIIEQCFRVLSVYLLFRIYLLRGIAMPLSGAAIGLLAGECASAVFSSFMLWIQTLNKKFFTDSALFSFSKCLELTKLAFPFSLNRICLSLFTTVETFQLPKQLMASGLNSAQALSIYGVFSGMAFPLIMFPCALTGSAATLLLPSISQAQAKGNTNQIKKAAFMTIILCFLLGFGCMFFLLTFANVIGSLLFQSKEASAQIRALSFACPFLYLSGMLSSILHGLGKTGITFLFSLISIVIRLFFVMYIVPLLGMNGYFYGILCSQICLDFLLIVALHHNIIYN